MQKQTLKKIGIGATIIVATLFVSKTLLDAPDFYKNRMFAPPGQFSEPPTSKHLPKSAGTSAFDSSKLKPDNIIKK